MNDYLSEMKKLPKVFPSPDDYPFFVQSYVPESLFITLVPSSHGNNHFATTSDVYVFDFLSIRKCFIFFG